MKLQRIGTSGVWVSELCLGTMMFGDQTDESTSNRIITAAKAAGVNFIDTANSYAKGGSEEIIGRALKTDRDHWIVASKVGSPLGSGPIEGTLSRRRIQIACERTLKRMQMETLDIYYLHRDDLDTPLEEAVGALGDLIRDGKIRYWGFSNFNGWRIGELVRVADALGVTRPIVMQPLYNAMNRAIEQEHLPACQHYGMGVVPYSPLARGVLTGKYSPDDAPPPDSRAGRKDARILESEFRRESLQLAQEIKAHAEARGSTAAAFALNWVRNNALVSSVIVGPKSFAQWQGYLASLDHPFSAEDEALVNRLVTPGFNSTPFFGDAKLPAMGRKPRTA